MKTNGQVLPIAVHEAANSRALIKLNAVARTNGFETLNFTNAKLTILVDFYSADFLGTSAFNKFWMTQHHQYFKH